MTKFRRTLVLFIVILLQSAVAVTAGITAIYIYTEKTIPPGVYAGSVDIGGMSKLDAEKKLKEYYSASLKEKSLELALDGGDKFSIPYSDIDASLDSTATVEFMHGWKAASYLPNLLSAYFGKESLKVPPIIRFNEGKLREKLIELSKHVDREPVDASVTLEGGKLVRKPEASGLKLNVANTVDVINKQIAVNPDSPVLLGTAKNYEIQTAPAKVRLKDLDDIQQVLGEYTTDIIDPEVKGSITVSAKAINGVIIPASGSNGNLNVFSFVEWLKKQDPAFENDNEGYDQVASTLYAAILSTGIDKSGITRLPHKLAVEYIEPGLDAWISGSAGDLKFVNSFGHKLAIFANITGEKVTVSIAGERSDKKNGIALSTVVVQKFDPPVVNVENNSLKPGETVVLSPGKEGSAVDVYRGKELISTDKYEAVKAIVQIGPDTEWTSDDK